MKILNVPEAAAVLPCCTRQVYRLIREKQLEGTYYRVGRRIFFKADKLEQWKENGGSIQYEESDE